jgi:hypothetical protein
MEVTKDAMLGVLAEALAAYKHDLTAPITPTTNFMHGPAGIFGAPGLERDIFSTRVRPRGLIRELPAIGTNLIYPVVGYLTGFTDEQEAAEKSGVCDPAIQAGKMKSCVRGSQFGRVERATEPLEINKVGQVTSRAEMFDLRVVNDPLLQQSFAVPGQVTAEFQRILNSEVLARWYTLGAAFEKILSRMVFTGNPANNTVGGGYAEYTGLEGLLGTNFVDVFTNTICYALDSYIRNFNYGSVENNTEALLTEIVEMARHLTSIAVGTGLDPVDFAFVMREDLFNQIADRWPCVYNTTRCATANTTVDRVVIDGGEMKRDADAMRTGRYLKIDGKNWPVIIDDAMPEATNTTNNKVPSGSFASDIYLLPLVVNGGTRTLFFEYFNFDAPNGAMAAVRDGMLGNAVYKSSDGGRFLWTTSQTLWCLNWTAKIEPRLRLLTPHLAGRIQNVLYTPHVHTRSPFPDDPYNKDGGVTTRTNKGYAY